MAAQSTDGDDFKPVYENGQFPRYATDNPYEKELKSRNEELRAVAQLLLRLCETARSIMLGDLSDDRGIEDHWLADFEGVAARYGCARCIEPLSTNWREGKAYDYCPECGFEPSDKESSISESHTRCPKLLPCLACIWKKGSETESDDE